MKTTTRATFGQVAQKIIDNLPKQNMHSDLNLKVMPIDKPHRSINGFMQFNWDGNTFKVVFKNDGKIILTQQGKKGVFWQGTSLCIALEALLNR